MNTPPSGPPTLAEVLVALGSRLIATSDPRDAARAVAEAADAFLGWDACFVALYNEADNTATNLYIADVIEGQKTELELEYKRPRVASPLFQRCLREGPLLISFRKDGLSDLQYHFGDTSRHTESLIFVPIRDQQLRSIGLLSIQSYEEDAYNEGSLRVVSLLADLVASALVRAELEENLEHRKTTIDLLASDLPAIIWTVDRELRFTSSNGAGLQSIGLRPNQVVGMKLSDFLRGTGDTVSEDAHLRALNGEEMHFDVGTYGRHYHVSLRPLRHRRGEIVGVAGLALDTTASRQADEARRELELRMVQTQKLESLGILAGGIAHDFNNLLVGVLGNAGIALSEVATDHPAHEPLVSIEHAAQRMRDLTRQLLAYSGRGKFLTRALDLNDVLRESRDFVAAGMSRKIEFLVEYDSEPLPIRADPVQLRQLLLNLASNASDSLEDKPGRIRLATHRRRLTPVELPQMVEIPPSLDGEFAVIEMEDNGCGMAAEIITRIFDPFYTTKAQGRGLGLAAVSGIVRSHGGGIQIQSIPRNGTTVRIFLPLLEETPLPLAPTLRERRLEGTILVADDEQVILDFVRPVLERAGLNVLVARDGEAALHLYEEHSTAISMVILDVIMPRLGGAETYLELRKRNPRLPALFISGATDQDLTRKGLRVSPHHVLTKPFTHEQLLAKVGAFF